MTEETSPTPSRCSSCRVLFVAVLCCARDSSFGVLKLLMSIQVTAELAERETEVGNLQATLLTLQKEVDAVENEVLYGHVCAHAHMCVICARNGLEIRLKSRQTVAQSHNNLASRCVRGFWCWCWCC